MADCDACGRPVPDVAFVCPACADCGTEPRCGRCLADRLHHNAGLWPDLLATAAGQARMTDPGPRARGMAPAEPARPDIGGADQVTGPPTGLPFRWNAAEIRDDVRNTVTTWCRVVLDERSPAPAEVRVLTGIRDLARWDGPPADTPGMMRWLAGQLGWCRYQRWAGEMWDHLADELRRIEPAVDRPPPRLDAGLCLAELEDGSYCPQRLSAPPGARRIHCPDCGGRWEATDRSTLILAAAEHLLGTAAELSAWLAVHGELCPEGTIRSWASRGQLLRHGRDPQTGVATYRLGEVRRMAASRVPRRERIRA